VKTASTKLAEEARKRSLAQTMSLTNRSAPSLLLAAVRLLTASFSGRNARETLLAKNTWRDSVAVFAPAAGSLKR